MSARILTARYAGRCRGCGGRFEAGTRIAWAGKRQSYHLQCSDSGGCERCESSGTIYVGHDEPVPCPDCAPQQHEELRRRVYPSRELAVLEECARAGATMHYTNPGGRCEDAPCCGCCS